jgi:regulator of protease activity HflC (stomatin/prohibitin superfamily)
MMTRAMTVLVPLVLVVLGALLLGSCSFKSVPAGHVGVASLFGKVVDEPYTSGMHFPVNPLYNWTLFDARQNTHKETAGVPSQDQLTTQVDVSVQYRLSGAMAPKILQDTGTAEQAIAVHLVPTVRSLLREQGKTIARAEDFFLEETQQQLQESLLAGLRRSLEPNGIIVSSVLIRDISLPPRLVQQIEEKKQVEQQAERQKAELDRYSTEQQQKVVQARAEREAAEEEAQKQKVLADAKAYEIGRINEAIAQNPAYIQLEALRTLQTMSKDPASKLYFMNSESQMPIPLMNIGQAGRN